jgi:hypothetical protein
MSTGIPLAYLITIRCYGSWLHGDERYAVDRDEHHVYRMPRITPNPNLKTFEETELLHPPVILNESQRPIVEQAIVEVCQHRGYELQAVQVRTNHVHSVETAACKPETVMNALKSYATRRL